MFAGTTRVLISVITILSIVACAQLNKEPADPWASMRQPDGTVLWMDEYQFVPPPKPWMVIDLNENDLSIAFFRSCDTTLPGEASCESSMAYAGEPFGYSRNLEARAHEFFKRYLWAARVNFSEPELTPTVINGREALVAVIIGEEPVRKYKVKARVVFMKRGERVVAFFMNQWRAESDDFNPEQFSVLNNFVESFRFTKPSFYETL